MKIFDENEKVSRNNLITWNDEKGFPIFGEDRKKSRNKNYKRIGIHWIMINENINIDDSPTLIKCKGCKKNIEVMKLKSKVKENGKKSIEYLVMWKIRHEEFVTKNEINFNRKFKVLFENEYKILLRCLIIGIILLNSNSELILGLDGKFCELSKNYRKFKYKTKQWNKFTFWQCAQEDTKERAYKIKNWIKELLTYSVLFKRKIFGLIMIPAQDAIRKKKIGIINGNDFVQVLEKPTRILLEELWCFCYENIRLKIWDKRCKDVVAIEEKKDLKKGEKKKRKKDQKSKRRRKVFGTSSEKCIRCNEETETWDHTTI
ncbi:hypothetical protein RhiirA5_502711 [Rhizophagus irregularis]|uniref:Uncharacterized protein n=1 Tax=Rhizophagus irregularis TaxID=588596 RepID=A0A2N0PCG0_9GLOM|nr:hypothetical protein RhiirA5_502711 [Rhizophagus irregularis]GET58307.1 hypothetical protein GLOIN_2v1843317 [Rhizophagus irregularis DAOM 181602=DAOM 197198]GET58463.1 hypothetical protein GLOIN_2v1843317 [Rhizophagus irregularis DAOM 181602=DAOM 197198]GET64862.1 hypothetical protein GLOIN_2v1843317 [Rhizophagus irregularis DAOM 181602=DAOM 197198]GET66306.1 hypothetical protein GLOIN_2v1843317 [Rhizophagus irregularis DAOM 181602=DAOM 197198]